MAGEILPVTRGRSVGRSPFSDIASTLCATPYAIVQIDFFFSGLSSAADSTPRTLTIRKIYSRESHVTDSDLCGHTHGRAKTKMSRVAPPPPPPPPSDSGTKLSAFESLPTAVVALVFAATAPTDWVRLRRVSRNLGATAALVAAGPRTLDFYDRKAQLHEHAFYGGEEPLAPDIDFYIGGTEATASHRAASLAAASVDPTPKMAGRCRSHLTPLPKSALLMSPTHVTLEADTERLTQLAQCAAWRNSLRSLTLVLPVWQQLLELGPLNNLRTRLTRLSVLAPLPEDNRDEAVVRKTLLTLPRLPSVTHFECDGQVPDTELLAHWARVFPALETLAGMRP